MLQIRAGHCPRCGELTAPDLSECPSCGESLQWQITAALSGARKPASKRATAPVAQNERPHWALLAALVGLCLLVVLAVSVKMKVDNPLLPGHLTSPDPETTHGASVQDAQSLRSLAWGAANGDTLKAAPYIVSIDMPAGTDTLEITLGNTWNNLDYSTRLSYAQDIASHWIAIHAPNRAYFRLLNMVGEEVGGRSWSGKVWVRQQESLVTVPIPLAPPDPAATLRPAATSATAPAAATTSSTPPAPALESPTPPL